MTRIATAGWVGQVQVSDVSSGMKAWIVQWNNSRNTSDMRGVRV